MISKGTSVAGVGASPGTSTAAEFGYTVRGEKKAGGGGDALTTMNVIVHSAWISHSYNEGGSGIRVFFARPILGFKVITLAFPRECVCGEGGWIHRQNVAQNIPVQNRHHKILNSRVVS